MTADDPPVTAEPPESPPVPVTGVDHITLVGSNVEDTIEFYRDVLGMPLVLRQPNLDAPEVTHLFFDPGDGRVLTFFVKEDRDSDPRPIQTPMGGVHHVAFSVEAERLAEIKENLDERGQGYNEFDRGAFHSLYTTDHNGFVIELAAEKYDVPAERRAEVLALAQQKRVEAGAEYVDDEHMQAALDELGLPSEPKEVPEAASGTGGL